MSDSPERLVVRFFERKALIRGAKLKPHQKHFLHVLTDYLRYNEFAWPCQESLALDLGLSVTRVQQIIPELSALRVIKKREQESDRSRLEYAIRFDVLATMQVPRKPNWSRRTRVASSLDPMPTLALTDPQDPKPTLGLATEDPKPALVEDTKPALAQHPKPALARRIQEKQTRKPPPPASDEWQEVESDLENEGVAKASEAVAGAHERGYTPEQARLVIQHYRANAGAWKSGALFRRLTSIGPNIPIEGGWPKVDPAFTLKQQRAKEVQQRAAEDRLRREDDEKRKLHRQREDNELQRLEVQFGAECDRLTADDLRQMAMQDPKLAMPLKVAKPSGASPLTSSPFLRSCVLRHLAARSPPALTTAQTKTDDSLP